MPAVGDCVAGRYRLENQLGEGGMGSVWRARHLELDAPVAVKFQHAHRAGSSGAAARFRKEARAAARLVSPNIVKVIDFGIDDGVPYLVMELLQGESLRARLEREPMPALEQVLDIISQAASALDAAHAGGIIHRDFKPSNLFLVPSGEREIVKLLDFGIAKWFEGDPSSEGTLTDDELVLGSVPYMSPEQATGQVLDPRTDVWSLAVVAYQMLSGVNPFLGVSIVDTLSRICAARFEPLALARSPSHAPLDPVFQRAFERARELRFETATEFSSALSSAAGELLAGERELPRPASAAAAASGWAFGRDDATVSLPLEPARGGARKRRPSLGIAALSALGLAAALAMALRSPRVSSPTTAPATTPKVVSAPLPAKPPTPAPAAEPAASAAAQAPPAERPATRPKPKAAAKRHAAVTPTPERAAVSAAGGASAAPASAALATTASASSAPARSAAVRASEAVTSKRVHPVFGLEVQAQR